jgi:uncharacterized membrane protein
MKFEKIKKYYLIQLGISFLIAVIGINLLGFLNEIDDYSQNRLILLSLIGGAIFMIGNAIINSLNFNFNRNENFFIAFFLPIIIWTILLIFNVMELFEGNEIKIENLIAITVLTEPIIYNLTLKKAVNNNF